MSVSEIPDWSVQSDISFESKWNTHRERCNLSSCKIILLNNVGIKNMDQNNLIYFIR